MNSGIYVVAIAGAVALSLPAPAAAQIAKDLKVKIDVSNLPADQQAVAKMAEKILQDIVVTEKFRQAVQLEVGTDPDAFDLGAANFKQRNRRVVSATKDQIWQVVRRGHERNTKNYPNIATQIPGNPAQPDNVIAINIAPTPKPRGIVGSTALGSSTVRTATWFLAQTAKRKDAISLARHLMHEWIHSAGFFHTKDGPNQKDVAYRMGDLIRKMATTPGTPSDDKAGLQTAIFSDKRVIVDGVSLNPAEFKNEDDLAVYWLETDPHYDVEGFDEDLSD